MSSENVNLEFEFQFTQRDGEFIYDGPATVEEVVSCGSSRCKEPEVKLVTFEE